MDHGNLIYFIANLFRVFSINLFLETIFSKHQLRCSAECKYIVLSLYYVLNSIIYLYYQTPIVTVLSNLFLFFFLTLPYSSTIYKRLFVTFCVFLLGILCETIVSRTSILILGDTGSIQVITYTVSNFLFYIVVLLTKSILGKDEQIYQKSHWAVLILIPSVSAFIDILVIYGTYTQWITVTIIFCLFLINIAFFYLYQIIVSNYEVKIQNHMLLLQNKAYQQQLDMIHSTEERLSRARHDFKNHLIALDELAQSDDQRELKAYLQKLDQAYQITENYVYTGNQVLDGLINHKLKIMASTGAEVKIETQIPENMDINPFDLVVILGNLLDNAIESLSQQKEGSFEIQITYKQGMLLINTKNTYHGEIIKKGNKFISTKQDTKELHGIGLSNVKCVVEKYQGEMIIDAENHIFNVYIILYI